MVSDLGTVYTASWYGGSKLNGRKTASGEVFNDQLFTTAASNHYKMYDLLLVTNVKNGKSVQVYVNDRGGFSKYDKGRRRLDLSKKAFETIAPLSQGVAEVTIEVLNKEDTNQIN